MQKLREAIRHAYGRPFQIRQARNATDIGAQIYIFNAGYGYRWGGSVAEFMRQEGILAVRSDVTDIEYHRGPTASELRFGEGATHYATFGMGDCCHPGTRVPKAWLVSPRDGLRYYR